MIQHTIKKDEHWDRMLAQAMLRFSFTKDRCACVLRRMIAEDHANITDAMKKSHEQEQHSTTTEQIRLRNICSRLGYNLNGFERVFWTIACMNARAHKTCGVCSLGPSSLTWYTVLMSKHCPTEVENWLNLTAAASQTMNARAQC